MERAITTRRENRLGTRFQDEMNNIFARFLGDNDLLWSENRTFWPAIDVAEHEGEVVVKAEVPGCKPEEVEILVQDHIMTIKGEKKDRTEEKKENYYHLESRHGVFRRDITLPAEINAEKIQAKYQDGVLTITMPKTEKAKARQIKIEA